MDEGERGRHGLRDPEAERAKRGVGTGNPPGLGKRHASRARCRVGSGLGTPAPSGTHPQRRCTAWLARRAGEQAPALARLGERGRSRPDPAQRPFLPARTPDRLGLRPPMRSAPHPPPRPTPRARPLRKQTPPLWPSLGELSRTKAEHMHPLLVMAGLVPAIPIRQALRITAAGSPAQGQG
jgi:hypothetical protein